MANENPDFPMGFVFHSADTDADTLDFEMKVATGQLNIGDPVKRNSSNTARCEYASPGGTDTVIGVVMGFHENERPRGYNPSGSNYTAQIRTSIGTKWRIQDDSDSSVVTIETGGYALSTTKRHAAWVATHTDDTDTPFLSALELDGSGATAATTNQDLLIHGLYRGKNNKAGDFQQLVVSFLNTGK